MSDPQRRPIVPAAVIRVASDIRGVLLSRNGVALWVAIAVNIVLAALFLWSRGGAETDIRVEVEDDRYHAYVDGKLQVDTVFPAAPTGGGVAIQLRANDISSLPAPFGVDSVRVTAADGETLFEDSFDPPSDRWQVFGKWSARDGVYAPSAGGDILIEDASWTDYAVEVKLRNISKGAVGVRVQDRGEGVFYVLTPVLHYGNELRQVEDGRTVEQQGGPRLELDRVDTARSMLAMVLRPYPFALAVIAGLAVVGLAARRLRPSEAITRLGSAVTRHGSWVALPLAVAAFGLLLYIIYGPVDRMPHVPDSVAYVFQSKIFGSFRITADAPPVLQSFVFFHPSFTLVEDGRWFTQYPFGHPLALAVGQVLSAPWLIPPLLGAVSVYLISRVGTHLFGVSVGLLAAVLLLFSPFFQMTASNFMSHNTAAFYIVAMLFLLVRPTGRRLLSMFGAGVCLGLLFNTRPLVGVMVMPVLGLLFAYDFARASSPRRELARTYASFAGGALLMLAAYFGYNALTTGSFLESPYDLQGTFSENSVGFSGRHSVAVGMQNEQVLLSMFLLVASGWPILIGLALAMMPFILGGRNKWDYFLLGALLLLAAGPVLYTNPAIMHGPRFWYEIMPFYALLSARGAKVLVEASSSRSWWLPSAVQGVRDRWAGLVVGLVVSSGILAFVGLTAYSWTLGQRDLWRGQSFIFVPENVAALEGFNGTDDRLLKLADEQGLSDALVFVDLCGPWQCYGSVAWTNSPDLGTDIVWVEAQGTDDDLRVLEAFPDRSVYRADYRERTLEPATRAEIMAAVESAGTETSSPPTAPGTPAERDLQRQRDLAALEEVIREYEAQFGELPSNGGRRQTLCVYRHIDAGCALREVLPNLPTDPLGNSTATGYWYVSDGETFVLIARLEAATETDPACPQSVVDTFGGDVVLHCVVGEATNGP